MVGAVLCVTSPFGDISTHMVWQSAAGVALMGQARGQYTFFSHLKWTPAIAVGYALSIWVHLLLSEAYIGVAPG